MDVKFEKKEYTRTPPPPRQIRRKASPREIYHQDCFTPMVHRDTATTGEKIHAYVEDFLTKKSKIDTALRDKLKETPLAKMGTLQKANMASDYCFDLGVGPEVKKCEKKAKELKDQTKQANDDLVDQWLAQMPEEYGAPRWTRSKKRRFATAARRQWDAKHGKVRKAYTPKRAKKAVNQQEEEEKEDAGNTTETDDERQKKMNANSDDEESDDEDEKHSDLNSLSEAMDRLVSGMSSSSSSNPSPSPSPSAPRVSPLPPSSSPALPTNALNIHILAPPPTPTLSKAEVTGHELRH